jgi:hypothetical protein
MFSRKKDHSPSGGDLAVPRGRAAAAVGPDNPLARRMAAGSEPPTVDLTDPARFHDAGEEQPPEASTQSAGAALDRVLSRDPATGKLYVHPGGGEFEVVLGAEPVTAPTELRAGDRVQLGPLEVLITRR